MKMRQMRKHVWMIDLWGSLRVHLNLIQIFSHKLIKLIMFLLYISGFVFI